jgi:hypothetical protein
MSNRHIALTKFNGFIFIDPEVKSSTWAIADIESGNNGRVLVHSLNKIFATVSDSKSSPKYTIMRNRLVRCEALGWPKSGPRDFPEDFPKGDNGCYQHTCTTCNETFFGYKRRVTCKLCEVKNGKTE